MNEVIRTMIQRRSVRKYLDKMIPREELEQILTAGKYAPTGMDRQHLLYIAVQDKEVIAQLSRMNAEIMGRDIDPYYGAQTIVYVLRRADVGTGVEDGSLALGNMMNAAQSLGIGSCWIHRAKEMFESEAGKALLKKWGVEGEYIGVGSLALGYAEDPAKEGSSRKEQVIYI